MGSAQREPPQQVRLVRLSLCTNIHFGYLPVFSFFKNVLRSGTPSNLLFRVELEDVGLLKHEHRKCNKMGVGAHLKKERKLLHLRDPEITGVRGETLQSRLAVFIATECNEHQLA